ncbi:MAG TPA: thiamine pyrophosphate-binding protein, partial [Thermodesulfobacteriota bacterium]|nr:thiamine pyrophosphate-binding protein [Thermodesulfobacteriota bacterium]
MTGAQVAVRTLVGLGVRTLFGIPGVHTLDLYDALLDAPGLRHVLARHEQGAGFMADGYARASGELGVAVTTTGPGVSNILTALAEAYASSVPVLLLASQIESVAIGRGHGALHEYPDQLALLRAVSGFAARADRPETIAPTILDAVRRLRLGRPRPACIEIPHDVLAAELPAAAPGDVA